VPSNGLHVRHIFKPEIHPVALSKSSLANDRPNTDTLISRHLTSSPHNTRKLSYCQGIGFAHFVVEAGMMESLHKVCVHHLQKDGVVKG
jgi:hypothetical protein